MAEIIYKRILLKMSGEVLKGELESGIDGDKLMELAGKVKELVDMGCEVAIVLGGGNIWRFKDNKELELSRVVSDQLGMMATCMNVAAFSEALMARGVDNIGMSSFPCERLLKDYDIGEAIVALNAGKVVLCAGGTGSPYFTTDSAAALRALELDCDLLLKATKVDYVYDKDPVDNPDAVKYETLKYSDVIEKKLSVMDMNCAALMGEHDVPMMVFNLNKEGLLKEIVCGGRTGTYISKD
ncbi:UMP kinase [Candidatus Peregrinibacteria bacterium HGW-Peregrinibacteria-1]|jgi:uridylate kinase|nr:MAG: UMP kinase [Candidatus Peregrinibacteria bacterium HGW-Peregrinibacteria-1]